MDAAALETNIYAAAQKKKKKKKKLAPKKDRVRAP